MATHGGGGCFGGGWARRGPPWRPVASSSTSAVSLPMWSRRKRLKNVSPSAMTRISSPLVKNATPLPVLGVVAKPKNPAGTCRGGGGGGGKGPTRARSGAGASCPRGGRGGRATKIFLWEPVYSSL